MNEKILYLEQRGCNDNAIPYDIKNYRINTIENIDIIYDGKNYNMFFEFTTNSHHKVRYNNKRTGEPLKHPVTETVVKNGIFVNTEFERQEGFWPDGKTPYIASYRNSKLEHEVWEKHYTYTRENILKIINAYSIEKYTKVVLIEEEAEKIINEIGGFREKDIIQNDCVYSATATETWNDEHKIVKAYKRENNKIVASCEVDLVTKRITG